MNPEDTAACHVLKVRLKLMVLIVGTPISHARFTWLLNKFFFHLPKSIPLVVSAIPIVSFIFYLWRNRKKEGDIASHCRYSPFCSFYFVHERIPVKNDNVDLAKIKKIQACDIILRRNRNYLVELIFGQNSYFTHVGICYSNDDNGIKILDCTSEHGVAFNKPEEFCSCDNLAILRFTIDDKTLNDKKIERLEVEEEEAIRKHIYNDNRTGENNEALKARELKIYDKINEALGADQFNYDLIREILNNNNCEEVIAERARSLRRVSFDYTFNFKSFDKFSCIEYVWYCYKCLYPLHRIKVSDFEYFRYITVPVIVPDVFLKNDFFKCVYTSFPGIDNIRQLQKHVQTKHWQFTKFFVNILLWDVVILYTLNKLFISRSKS